MIITNTPSIEGKEIERYLQPIASHVVFGTNIFSDIAASFRDVFGGRSASYQRQLEGLTNAAIKELRDKASKLRADAIVSMRLDYEELSAGKMGMLMVIATGTPVILTDSCRETDSNTSESITAEELSVEVKRIEFEVNHADQTDWWAELLTEAGRLGAESVWESICTHVAYRQSPVPEFEEYVGSLYSRLGYEWLRSKCLEDPSGFTRKLCIKQLSASGEFKEVELLDLLNNPDENIRRNSLQLLRCSTQSYQADDLDVLDKVISAIGASFPSRFERTIKMGRRRRETEVIYCQCGDSIDADMYCRSCNADEFGFHRSEINPTQAINLLKSRKKALANLVGG